MMKNFEMKIGLKVFLNPFKLLKIKKVHSLQERMLDFKNEKTEDSLHMADYRRYVLRSLRLCPCWDMESLRKASNRELKSVVSRMESSLGDAQAALEKMQAAMELRLEEEIESEALEEDEIATLLEEARSKGFEIQECGTFLAIRFRHTLPWSGDEYAELPRNTYWLRELLEKYDREEVEVQAQKETSDYESKVRMYYTMLSMH